MLDDAAERVHDYICRYHREWLRPPLLDEIGEDLSLTPRQVLQVLAILQNAGKILLGSLRPNTSVHIARYPSSPADG
jgi:hypothetical protein